MICDCCGEASDQLMGNGLCADCEADRISNNEQIKSLYKSLTIRRGLDASKEKDVKDLRIIAKYIEDHSSSSAIFVIILHRIADKLEKRVA